MTMPNFLIIGAGKAGTTSLYHYLKQHPQIYLSPRKEPSFFAFEDLVLEISPALKAAGFQVVTDLEAYQSLFAGVSNERAIGEASIVYLYSSRAPERIHHYLPEAKLMVILRDPVERAYSHYLMAVRLGLEPLTDFSQAIQAELQQADTPVAWWTKRHYFYAGRYYTHLRRYFDRFDQGQIRIYFYEELQTASLDLLRDIFTFLNVESTVIPDISLIHNKSGLPKSRALDRFIKKLVKPNPIKNRVTTLLPLKLRYRLINQLLNQNANKPPLAPQVRLEMIELYRDEILKLQELLQYDLLPWLTV